MRLETLANEILQEIFEYIDGIDLFRAFYNLNERFNHLLLVQFHAYRIDFHSIAKYQFELQSRQFLATINNQIVSLHISDRNDQTTSQTKIFFSLDLSLQNLTQLRSLSLCYINCDTTMRKLMSECDALPHLTHLKVIKCHSGYMSSIDFSNTIWNLPKLTHCRLNTRSEFQIPTNLSSNLKYFSITSSCWGLKQTINLFQSTTQLEYLRTPMNTPIKKQQQKLTSIPPIKILNLIYVQSLHGMLAILRLLPNLTILKVDCYYIDCDGHRWQELIETYLPKLEVFHLQMRIEIPGKKNNEKYVEKLMETYRTSFWLEQHRWFIRCHLMASEKLKTIYLYTIPFGFNDGFSKIFSMPYKSTDPQDDENQNLYNRLINLNYNSSMNCLSLARFSSIRNLSIDFSFDKQFWKNIPIFYSLISATVSSTNIDAQYHLQALIDRAPNLYSLTILSWPSFEVPTMKHAHPSIRQLNLQIDSLNQNDSVLNNELCQKFIQSPFAKQCEEFRVMLKDRATILELINGMPQLRILQIQYSSDLPFCLGYQECENENEIFMKWLQDRLPKKHVVICADRSSGSGAFLKIWIYLDK